MKSKPPYAQIKPGTLLVSSPDTPPGLFSRGVVLLCEHSSQGSLGLLLNKTIASDVACGLFGMDQPPQSHVRFCIGGPNQANQMMFLHNHPACQEEEIAICPSVYQGANIDLLKEILSSEGQIPACVFFGYTGWAGGQLEQEFMEGIWILSSGSEEYIFHTPVESLWSKVLFDLGGSYASLSTMPKQLLLN